MAPTRWNEKKRMDKNQGQGKGKKILRKRKTQNLMDLFVAALWGCSFCLGKLGEMTVSKPVRVEKKIEGARKETKLGK